MNLTPVATQWKKQQSPSSTTVPGILDAKQSVANSPSDDILRQLGLCLGDVQGAKANQSITVDFV
jgi:hypothetical protein